MIRHLFKLIWNRKRANALVITEIFVCFLVLFIVLTASLYSIQNYYRPLGFDYRSVSSVEIEFDESPRNDGSSSTTGSATPEPKPENPFESRQRALLQVAKADPAVEDAAWAWPLPFSHSNEVTSYTFRKHDIRYSVARVTDEYQSVMGIEITRGRWFSSEADGMDYGALVISEALAKQAFGDEDPAGKSLTADRSPDDKEPPREWRVVGVMRAFRQEGEMETSTATSRSFMGKG